MVWIFSEIIHCVGGVCNVYLTNPSQNLKNALMGRVKKSSSDQPLISCFKDLYFLLSFFPSSFSFLPCLIVLFYSLAGVAKHNVVLLCSIIFACQMKEKCKVCMQAELGFNRQNTVLKSVFDPLEWKLPC